MAVCNLTYINLSKHLANLFAKDNILVNAVCPGPIRTPLWEDAGQLGDQLGQMLNMSGPEAIKWFAEQNIPLGHHGDPEDVANLVAFLASARQSMWMAGWSRVQFNFGFR